MLVVGLDISKRFFQLHSVEGHTGEVLRKKLRRSEVLPFFVNFPPSVVAMEACGSSFHWARQFAKLGHQVRLIATKFVRPFVRSNKTDSADAQAIWEAAQRPEMRFVPVKSEHQQAILTLHSMRERLVKSRTAQLHQVRAVLYEFGHEMPEGRQWCLKGLPAAFEQLEHQMPAMVIDALRMQLDLIQNLTSRIAELERKLTAYQRTEPRCMRLLEIPGVGLLTATAIVASVGDARQFRSGREFAAWIGLVPRQSGTGGKVRLLGISKRGSSYLRLLLIHCARAVVARQKEHSPWLERLLATRPWNVAVVAQANKIARTIWAVLAHGTTFELKHT